MDPSRNELESSKWKSNENVELLKLTLPVVVRKSMIQNMMRTLIGLNSRVFRVVVEKQKTIFVVYTSLKFFSKLLSRFFLVIVEHDFLVKRISN